MSFKIGSRVPWIYMTIDNPSDKDKLLYNSVVDHPLQSFEWGEFRKKTGIKVIRRGVYEGKKLVSGISLTIHTTPYMKWTIGYLPKGNLPNGHVVEDIIKIGQKENCIFVQLEPNVERDEDTNQKIKQLLTQAKGKIRYSFHPLFTKYTFQLDLAQSEDEFLKSMHPKTRYNIKVAQRYGVEIVEDNSNEAFEKYMRLMEETTNRQRFYAHDQRYHRLQWETFRHSKAESELSSHLLLAKYKKKVLAAWILFIFKDTLYYPYGASSSEHREMMASNLIMWEAIRFGKRMGLSQFDMWGGLGENPDTKDQWYGFHKFKKGYGPKHIEFIGSFDLVITPFLYEFYKVIDKLRWVYLKLRRRLFYAL